MCHKQKAWTTCGYKETRPIIINEIALIVLIEAVFPFVGMHF